MKLGRLGFGDIAGMINLIKREIVSIEIIMQYRRIKRSKAGLTGFIQTLYFDFIKALICNTRKYKQVNSTRLCSKRTDQQKNAKTKKNKIDIPEKIASRQTMINYPAYKNSRQHYRDT